MLVLLTILPLLWLVAMGDFTRKDDLTSQARQKILTLQIILKIFLEC